MNGKTVVITGGNTGIGIETAKALAAAGAHVVIACRDSAKAASAVVAIKRSCGRDHVSWQSLDLGSLASINMCAQQLLNAHSKIDVLINNAGVWPRQRRATTQGWEQTIGINHIGHMALTLQLLPSLRKGRGSRVVVVSSGLHARGKMQWDDLMSEKGGFSGQRAYAQSKLANILFANELARREKANGITVNSLHPGVVKTQLAREFPELLRAAAGVFMVTPQKGAQTSVHVASSPKVAATTGQYFDKCAPAAVSKAAQRVEDAARLWQWTQQQIDCAAI
jgi:NAD(P)-dependent dehydrogenase (short-subunit alcohol dehydrogenase family)